VAVSQRWLAWRAKAPDRISVIDLNDPVAAPRTVATANAPASVSRPSLDGDVLVFALAGLTGSKIRSIDLATGAVGTLRTARRALLSQPSIHAGRLLYVRASARHQQLLQGAAVPRSGAIDRELLRIRSTTQRDRGHDEGHTTQGRLGEDRRRTPVHAARYVLWSTALGDQAAFVTRLRNGTTADIVRVQL